MPWLPKRHPPLGSPGYLKAGAVQDLCCDVQAIAYADRGRRKSRRIESSTRPPKHQRGWRSGRLFVRESQSRTSRGRIATAATPSVPAAMTLRRASRWLPTKTRASECRVQRTLIHEKGAGDRPKRWIVPKIDDCGPARWDSRRGPKGKWVESDCSETRGYSPHSTRFPDIGSKVAAIAASQIGFRICAVQYLRNGTLFGLPKNEKSGDARPGWVDGGLRSNQALRVRDSRVHPVPGRVISALSGANEAGLPLVSKF